MSIDTDTIRLHFGVVPLPPMGYASIAHHDDPAEARTIATWGSLSANVAGTWTEWGEDPDADYADNSLHVSVDLPERMEHTGTLDEVAADVRTWLAGLLDRRSRLLDYAIATDAEDERARVLTFNQSGANVWERAS